MSIILAICEYNINTSDIFCIPYGCFKTKDEAKLFAEAKIQDDKHNYINEYEDKEYVEDNYIFSYTIKDISKMYNTGDTHTTEKYKK